MYIYTYTVCPSIGWIYFKLKIEPIEGQLTRIMYSATQNLKNYDLCPVLTKLGGKFIVWNSVISTSICLILPSQVIEPAECVLGIYVPEWHWKMHNSFSFVRNKLGRVGGGGCAPISQRTPLSETAGCTWLGNNIKLVLSGNFYKC